MQRNLVKLYFNKKKKSLIIKLTKIFEANVNILYVTSSINAYNIAHISTAYAYGSTRTIPYLLKYIFPVSLLYYHNIITILLTRINTTPLQSCIKVTRKKNPTWKRFEQLKKKSIPRWSTNYDALTDPFLREY